MNRRELLRRLAELPRLTISVADFDELPDYSASIPTGKFIGKMWRCRLACDRWVVRGYQPDPDPTMLLIPTWRPRFAFTSGPEFRRMAEQWRESLRSAGYPSSYANLR